LDNWIYPFSLHVQFKRFRDYVHSLLCAQCFIGCDTAEDYVLIFVLAPKIRSVPEEECVKSKGEV